MRSKAELLTEESVVAKLKRFAAKVDKWTFTDHPYQLQAEEAIVILEMLEKAKRKTDEQ